MSLRAALVRWTARMLLLPVTAAVDWDAVDLQEHVANDRLAAALDWSEIDLQDHVSNYRLAEALDWDTVDVYKYVDPDQHLSGPVERLHQLEDDPERAYVWVVKSEEAERQLTQMVVGAYREDFGREPEAAHFVVSDLEDLREMDQETVRIVDPAGGEA